MRLKIFVAGLMLVVFTSSAAAEQNLLEKVFNPTSDQSFVQKFLGRYRPSATVGTAAVTNQTPEPAIQQLIREGSLPITVADVIRFMVEGNLDVKLERFSPLTQQLLIDTLLKPFEPTLFLNANMRRNTGATVSDLIASQSLTHSYSATFAQNFATGTGLSVTGAMNRISDNNAFNTFNPSYAGSITYRINQNLLRDYGRNVNLRTLRVSKNNKTISDIQFEIDLITLVSSAQNLYWDLVFSREDIKVKQQSLALAQKTLADNNRQVEIGTLAPIEVTQTQANVATREEQMVLTNFASDQLQDRIKRMITSAGDPAMILAKLTPTEAVHRPNPDDVMPIEDAIRYALENRPEMRQLDLSLKNNDLDIAYQKNQLLPQLNVSASYTQSGVGGNQIDRATREITSRGGVGDAFGQIFGYNYTGYGVGFSLTVPLSNKSQQAEYSRAVAQKQSTEARRTLVAQNIALDVRNTYSAVDMNRQRIIAAAKAKELAERQLVAEQKKFELGSGQIRFVLQEQQNVTAAQTSEIAALVNYTKALVDFDRAIGRTLKRNNIEIDKDLKIAVRNTNTMNANQ